jgi:hypothetical protein
MADMPDIATAIWQSPDAQTVPIDFTGAGGGGTTSPIFTPDSGKRFACHYLRMHFQNGVIAAITFLSGSTALSGAITFDGTQSIGPPQESAFIEVCCGGMPIFLGRANGDIFNINCAGAAQDVRGFAVMTQIAGVA